MIEAYHPASYAYQARFTDLRPIAGGEGSTVYAGMENGRPALVTDGSTLADLLPDDDATADAVCIRIFESEGERARFFRALTRNAKLRPHDSAGEQELATDRLRLHSRGFEIRTPEDWFLFAPPKRLEAHWVPGRSALECALAWCGGPEGPATPVELQALLDSHPDTRGCRLTAAEPERPITFDDLRGEPRNADVAAVGTNTHALIAVTTEAKADEPFDRRVADLLARAVDRTAHGERTSVVQRVEQLAAALLPRPKRGLPGLGDLRYQLLTGLAGTLAYAAEVRAQRAVFVVHEFVTPATRDHLHRANAADLSVFLHRLSGGSMSELPEGQLVGPIYVPGGQRLTQPAAISHRREGRSHADPVALYIGKAQRCLRTSDT